MNIRRTTPPTSRRRLAVTTAIGLLIAASTAVLPASATAAPRSIDAAELQQVRLINRFRVARHLPALRIDRTLTTTANWMGADMGRAGYFGHTDSRGRDPFRRLRAFGYPSSSTWRGENLAAGNWDAPRTFTQWLNSPGHRANMENGRYRAIGIARVYVPGSQYGYYWVTEFGSRFTGSVR